MEKNYMFELEGHTVSLLGEGPFRRWFCKCAEYRAVTNKSGYAFCRHTQIISSRIAAHPIKVDPVKPTATILKFSPRLRQLQAKRR
jgi:hypothetical protein